MIHQSQQALCMSWKKKNWLHLKRMKVNNNIELGSDNILLTETTRGNQFLKQNRVDICAEIREIERVSNKSRQNTSLLLSLTMFMSSNLAIRNQYGCIWDLTFTSWIFRLVLVIVFWDIIGSLPVGTFAVFGAKFGLRQQILSGYLSVDTSLEFSFM